jgi:hypothetical protein
MGRDILMTVIMKSTVFWVVIPCSSDILGRFEGTF